MLSRANSLTLVGRAVVALVVAITSVSPAVSQAARCGEGTLYDGPSDTCVAVAQPPPSPPPPRAWHGPRPHVSVGICAPLRFVHICAGS